MPDQLPTSDSHNGMPTLSSTRKWRRTIAFAVGLLLLAASCILWRQLNQRAILTIELEKYAAEVAVSPDGQELCITTAFGNQLESDPASDEPQLMFRNLSQESNTESVRGRRPAICPRYLPNNKQIAVYDIDGIRFLDRDSKCELFRFDVPKAKDSYDAMQVSRDGIWLAVVRDLEKVLVWDLRDGKQIEAIPSGEVSDLLFVGNNELLLFDRNDGSCRVWSVTEGRWLPSLKTSDYSEELGDVTVSDDGAMLAAISVLGRLQVYDVKSRVMVFNTIAHEVVPSGFNRGSVCFSGGGRHLISCGEIERPGFRFKKTYPFYGKTSRELTEFKVWNIEDWRCIDSWEHRGVIYDVVPIPGSREIVSTDSDKRVIVWRPKIR